MGLAFRVIDALLGVAERVVRWHDDRRARRRQLERQGLSHRDVQHQQAQIRAASRPRERITMLPPKG